MTQPPNPKDLKKLDGIDALIQHKHYDEALQKTLAFVHERPKVAEGWETLAEIADELNHNLYLWRAAQALTQLEPHEDAYAFNLAYAAMKLESLFLARQSLDGYLERFPQGAMRHQIDGMKAFVDASIQDMVATGEIPANVSIDDMAAFELGRVFITHGDTAEGRRLSLQAARNLPGFPSPLNNVCLSYIVDGDLARALQIADRVLTEHPDNLFARATKAQLLVRLGRPDEARAIVEALAQESPSSPDSWVKILESCAYAHEHERVIDVYERAIAFFKAGTLPADPALHYFAGTAYALLGDARRAQSAWKKVPPDHLYGEPARANLSEFRRHGAWYFSLSEWIPGRWVEAMIGAVERGARRGEEAVSREIGRLMANTPGMEATLSLLFERGDPASLVFVLNLASYYPLPGLAAFAQSQRGQDDQRIQAAELASGYGLLSHAQPLTLSIQGETRDVRLFGFEIYSESVDDGEPLPKPVQLQIEAAHLALVDGEFERALSQAQQGRALAPKTPVFLNYMAVALHRLDRHDEADAINRQLAEEHPDYLFARTAMADLCMRDGRLDEAQTWLDPLLMRQRLHVSEFRALALSYIRYWQEKDEFASASHWIEMLDQVDPDSVTDEMRLVAKMSKLMDGVQNRRKNPKKRK